jgi:hypothetical protein
MFMGRKSHNLTEEQKRERKCKWRMRTYWKNAEYYRKKSKERYENLRDIRFKKCQSNIFDASFIQTVC